LLNCNRVFYPGALRGESMFTTAICRRGNRSHRTGNVPGLRN